MGMCVVGFVAKVYIDRWREDLYVHQVGGVLFIEFVSEVGMFGFLLGMACFELIRGHSYETK